MKLPDLELVLLRVFDAEHIAMFENHAMSDANHFVEEFVRRTCAPDNR